MTTRKIDTTSTDVSDDALFIHPKTKQKLAFPYEPQLKADGSAKIEVIDEEKFVIPSTNSKAFNPKLKYSTFTIREYPGNGMAIDTVIIAPVGTFTSDCHFFTKAD